MTAVATLNPSPRSPGRPLSSGAPLPEPSPRFRSGSDFDLRQAVLSDTLRALVSDATRERYRSIATKNVERWASACSSTGTAIKRSQSRRQAKLEILVTQGDWGNAAAWLTKRYGTTCAVLNMANSQRPGGGYMEGFAAQEENMFRRTDCHYSLDESVVDYSSNIYKREISDLICASHGKVYLDTRRPRVCLRGPEASVESGLGYAWLREDEIFPFYEMRAAAVDLRGAAKVFDEQECQRRIDAQLDTLMEHGIRHAVLSAFGCGALLNPAGRVAQCYKRALLSPLRRNYFVCIVFAILYPADVVSIFEEAFEAFTEVDGRGDAGLPAQDASTPKAVGSQRRREFRIPTTPKLGSTTPKLGQPGRAMGAVTLASEGGRPPSRRACRPSPAPSRRPRSAESWSTARGRRISTMDPTSAPVWKGENNALEAEDRREIAEMLQRLQKALPTGPMVAEVCTLGDDPNKPLKPTLFDVSSGSVLHLARSDEDNCCPHCSQELPAEALFCYRCGRRQQKHEVSEGAAEDTDGSPADPLVSTTACLSCGNLLMQDSNFCRKCGEKRLQDYNEMRFQLRYGRVRLAGSAVHVAALADGGGQTVRRLAQLGANIAQDCTWSPGQSCLKLLPLHLAAGCGNAGAISALVEAKADVDAKCRLRHWTATAVATPASQLSDGAKWMEHYTPLHEATFFQSVSAVDCLLSLKADTNSKNAHGSTPLHVAAKQGDATIAKRLLEGRADPLATDHSSLQSTPLTVAVDHGRFPQRALHLLARKSFEDLLLVARLCPAAASELLAACAESDAPAPGQFSSTIVVSGERTEEPFDRADTGEASQTSVRTGQRSKLSRKRSFRTLLLQDHASEAIERWVRLMGVAPAAGKAMLEALTTSPEERDKTHHPLPTRTRLPRGVAMRCLYTDTKIWEYYPEAKEQTPSWHNDFAPASSAETAGPDELVSVKVQLVRLPNIICPSILQAFAATRDGEVFETLAAQAIIEAAWTGLVRRFYFKILAGRMIEMAALVAFVAAPSDDRVRWTCWGILLMTSHRDFLYEVYEMIGYVSTLRQSDAYFHNPRNFLDILTICLLVAMLYRSHSDARLDKHPEQVAVLVLSRWVRLIFTFRAFPWVGQKIFPLICAFDSLRGILLVTMFVFAGFLHASAALDVDTMPPRLLGVCLGAFRMLFMGDGDGIDTVLSLGESGSAGSLPAQVFFALASALFCICMLNLFIAVLGEAYDLAREQSEANLLRERAAICLQCLLQPAWLPFGGRCRFGCRPLHMAMVILCFGFAGYAAILELSHFASSGAVAASIYLLVCVCFADAWLLQRPWSRDDSPKYLWICSRLAEFHDEVNAADKPTGMSDGSAVSLTDDTGSEGRFTALRLQDRQLCQRQTETLYQLEESSVSRLEVMDRQLANMDAPLRHVEAKMERLVEALKEMRRSSTKPSSLPKLPEAESVDRAFSFGDALHVEAKVESHDHGDTEVTVLPAAGTAERTALPLLPISVEPRLLE
eukprot:TRINITY_DN23969_c0_g1_i3.p1 TRINITY_DN23969_c0_g1~~TRINITY_DN23969_c0_g1_i3.p1  ORF type:complete len:1496 (-),score=327.42 TRINITY_DN23969_c0_g1_i3:91-4578(-)